MNHKFMALMEPLGILHHLKFRALDQISRIDRNPDTSWSWWIIVTPVNDCKQFQMELFFTIFWKYLPGGVPSRCRAGSTCSVAFRRSVLTNNFPNFGTSLRHFFISLHNGSAEMCVWGGGDSILEINLILGCSTPFRQMLEKTVFSSPHHF